MMRGGGEESSKQGGEDKRTVRGLKKKTARRKHGTLRGGET